MSLDYLITHYIFDVMISMFELNLQLKNKWHFLTNKISHTFFQAHQTGWRLFSHILHLFILI